MPDRDGPVLLARGQWWAGLPAIVELMTISCLVGFGFMVAFEDFSWFLLFLFGFAFPVPVGLMFAVVWAASAGRVRYELEGATVTAYRGRRQMGVLDLREFDRLGLDGRLTWVNVLLKGQQFFPFGMLDGLPRLVAEKRLNRWETEETRLPHILLWGREAGDAVEARLKARAAAAPVD